MPEAEAMQDILVVAVTVLMIAPPTDIIRNQIVSEVRAETGREFKIAGPASFTFFPSVGMRVRDVSLSAPPEMGGEPVLTAQSLDVGVRLWPLIRQEIVVDRLVLTKPVFNLRVDAQGRRSWDMAAVAAPVRFAQAVTTLTDAPMQVAANGGPERRHDIQLGELSLGDVRIIDGTARYSDERNGTSQQITAIDAEVQAPSLVRPVDAKGSFLSEGEKIAFDAKITSLGDLLEQRPAKLALNVSGRPLNVRYDGTITAKDDIAAEGNVSGDTSSFRDLAQWLGTRLPRSAGFGPASIVGSLRAGGDSWRFADAKVTLDGATATGTIGVITSGKRPHVVADLKVSDLNLDTYAAKGAPGEQPAAAPGQAPPPQSAPSQPRSIDDLLEQPGPKVKGFTQRDGWSGPGRVRQWRRSAHSQLHSRRPRLRTPVGTFQRRISVVAGKQRRGCAQGTGRRKRRVTVRSRLIHAASVKTSLRLFTQRAGEELFAGTQAGFAGGARLGAQRRGIHLQRNATPRHELIH